MSEDTSSPWVDGDERFMRGTLAYHYIRMPVHEGREIVAVFYSGKSTGLASTFKPDASLSERMTEFQEELTSYCKGVKGSGDVSLRADTGTQGVVVDLETSTWGYRFAKGREFHVKELNEEQFRDLEGQWKDEKGKNQKMEINMRENDEVSKDIDTSWRWEVSQPMPCDRGSDRL